MILLPSSSGCTHPVLWLSSGCLLGILWLHSCGPLSGPRVLFVVFLSLVFIPRFLLVHYFQIPLYLTPLFLFPLIQNESTLLPGSLPLALQADLHALPFSIIPKIPIGQKSDVRYQNCHIIAFCTNPRCLYKDHGKMQLMRKAVHKSNMLHEKKYIHFRSISHSLWKYPLIDSSRWRPLCSSGSQLRCCLDWSQFFSLLPAEATVAQ